MIRWQWSCRSDVRVRVRAHPSPINLPTWHPSIDLAPPPDVHFCFISKGNKKIDITKNVYPSQSIVPFDMPRLSYLIFLYAVCLFFVLPFARYPDHWSCRSNRKCFINYSFYIVLVGLRDGYYFGWRIFLFVFLGLIGFIYPHWYSPSSIFGNRKGSFVDDHWGWCKSTC